MAERRIEATTQINASAARVWAILTDFARMPSWNPFIKSISGNLAQGARDRDHFIPLKDSELAEIDSWSCSDAGPWITNAAGQPMSPQAISNALEQFVTDAPEWAGPLIRPHGLRAMAVCDRRLVGLSHQQISAQLCMSLGMVMRYSMAAHPNIQPGACVF
jgi:Polyketide cyclase / dehydrase and lipid transport